MEIFSQNAKLIYTFQLKYGLLIHVYGYIINEMDFGKARLYKISYKHSLLHVYFFIIQYNLCTTV